MFYWLSILCVWLHVYRQEKGKGLVFGCKERIKLLPMFFQSTFLAFGLYHH